jgi:hypothetical protein
MDSHRPESFQMTRFVIATEQNKCRGKSAPEIKKPDTRATVTALRVMRPAQPVRVEPQNEQPAKVYLQGMRGEVVSASGPWRSSGDWWQEDPWHQDEWDLEIEFDPSRQNPKSLDAPQFPSGPQRGLYRIFYDALRQGWFVRGVYD